eukprot:TRINITY_DN180_c0_g1_i3.p1 TRINITY_DN180_c0_g1~~TRINITY_DN180_c0_g1_i3.p1  ORF type:complete len:440 (-),score=31.96 TRINITY_DN180_c0_g1_i3:169-1488(-)
MPWLKLPAPGVGPLLVLLTMPFLNPVTAYDRNSCPTQSESSAWLTGVSVGLRTVDMAGSIIPMGPLPDLFWAIYDVTAAFAGGSNDAAKQIICYLNKYHEDRLAQNFEQFSRALKLRKNSRSRLDNLRQQMAQIQVTTSLQSGTESLRAAIYPMISMWTVLHIGVYKQLISKTTNSNTRQSLKQESDQWLIYYSKLLLRYSRSARHYGIETTRSKNGDFWQPAPTQVIKLSNLAQTAQTKTEMRQLANSCQLTSSTWAMFRYKGRGSYTDVIFSFAGQTTTGRYWEWLDGNDFLSCWVSGSRCTNRHCAESNILKYNSGWVCRGEMFKVYADSSPIKHHDTLVQIRYSIWGSKGYWLSNDSNTLKTRTCPGKNFRGIGGCTCEQFRILKWNKRFDGDQNIYDGDILILKEGNLRKGLYELYLDNSECSNVTSLYSPAVH